MVDTYRFVGGQWVHADAEDVSSLRTGYGYATYGLNFAFGDGFLAISQRSYATADENNPFQAMRVYDIDDSGRLGNWQALLAPARGPQNNFARSIAADGNRIAAFDAFGSVTSTHVRGVTSLFERVGGTWVLMQTVPAAALRPIAACGIGAMDLAGEVSLAGDRLFISNGGGESQDGSPRSARIDTFNIASGQSSLIDSMPTDTLTCVNSPDTSRRSATAKSSCSHQPSPCRNSRRSSSFRRVVIMRRYSISAQAARCSAFPGSTTTAQPTWAKSTFRVPAPRPRRLRRCRRIDPLRCCCSHCRPCCSLLGNSDAPPSWAKAAWQIRLRPKAPVLP